MTNNVGSQREVVGGSRIKAIRKAEEDLLQVIGPTIQQFEEALPRLRTLKSRDEVSHLLVEIYKPFNDAMHVLAQTAGRDSWFDIQPSMLGQLHDARRELTSPLYGADGIKHNPDVLPNVNESLGVKFSVPPKTLFTDSINEVLGENYQWMLFLPDCKSQHQRTEKGFWTWGVGSTADKMCRLVNYSYCVGKEEVDILFDRAMDYRDDRQMFGSLVDAVRLVRRFEDRGLPYNPLYVHFRDQRISKEEFLFSVKGTYQKMAEEFESMTNVINWLKNQNEGEDE
ncbi:MAG: hypothetical protein KKD18_06280 [Nanoarchaeota archaeon]|nr:hypothetical protein [Nanoarchaeota archaeon]MBU0978000.1 hypothetical protein [Nanoarchaeota archaeon]